MNGSPILPSLVIGTIFLSIQAPAAVAIDWALIGDANNAANTNGRGAVGYEYAMARNETTITQYAEFLNSVTYGYSLYSGNWDGAANGIRRSFDPTGPKFIVAGNGNLPITGVTWFDAARFVNWLHNGQGNSSTESGVQFEWSHERHLPSPAGVQLLAADPG